MADCVTVAHLRRLQYIRVYLTDGLVRGACVRPRPADGGIVPMKRSADAKAPSAQPEECPRSCDVTSLAVVTPLPGEFEPEGGRLLRFRLGSLPRRRELAAVFWLPARAVGGQITGGVVSWDPRSRQWTRVGDGIGGQLRALVALDPDGPGGLPAVLYAAGETLITSGNRRRGGLCG